MLTARVTPVSANLQASLVGVLHVTHSKARISAAAVSQTLQQFNHEGGPITQCNLSVCLSVCLSVAY